MEVNKVSKYFSTPATAKKNNLDKDAFLKILTAQLSNQDPMNAKDNSEYVAQMAQFTALEQTQNLNATIEKLLSSQKITEGAMMLNKDVEFRLSDDTIVKERVKSVKIESNNVYLVTESGKYNINQVISVGAEEIAK